MKCEKVKSLLYDYLRAELSPAEHNAADFHIKNCPHCADELHALARVKTIIMEGLEEPPVSVLEKDFVYRREKFNLPVFLRPAIAVAVMFLFSFGASLVFQSADSARLEAYEGLAFDTQIFYQAECELNEEMEIYAAVFGQDSLQEMQE